MLERFEAVKGATGAFCRERLSEDYAELAECAACGVSASAGRDKASQVAEARGVSPFDHL
jgi:hypothetical protein